MKKILLLLLLAAALGTGAFLALRRQAAPNGVLRLSGNVEATEAELSFRVPGRLAERLVDEGETVRAGQVVARLDALDLERQVAVRRAEVAAARAALADLVAGSRPEEIARAEAAAQRAQAALDALLAGSRRQEVGGAAAVVGQARAEVERLSVEAERTRRLRDAGLATAQQDEAAETSYLVARGRLRETEERQSLVAEGPRPEEIRQARAALAEAREGAALARKGPRPDAVAGARARLEQALQTQALAETALSYATLASPLSGLVLSKSAEPGEVLAAGTPVVTVADLGRVWLRVYVPETELGRVRVGQRARVTTDGSPGRTHEGRVSFVSSQSEFTPKAVQTPKERVKLVYRVKVDVPNPRGELKPGMPADAVIEADSR